LTLSEAGKNLNGGVDKYLLG
jgi:hypothetical protein